MKPLGPRIGGVAFLASALTAWAILRPGASEPEAEQREAIEQLRARLARSAFIDLVDFEAHAREIADRAGADAPQVAPRVRELSAEAAARRFLEYGERPTDRRAARVRAGPVPTDPPPIDGPWLAWAVAADTATAARALRRALDDAAPTAEVWEARAVLRRRSGDVAGALGDFSAAVAAAPARSGTQRLFGRLLAEWGANGSAVDAFRAGPPTAGGALHALAAASERSSWGTGPASSEPLPLDLFEAAHPWERGRRALLELAIGTLDGIDDRLALAAAAYPDRAGFRRAIADAALAHRRFSMAATLYREALDLEPGHRVAEVGLARARFASKLDRCRVGAPLELGELEVEPGQFELVRFRPDATVFPEHLYAELRDRDDDDRTRGFAVANRVALAEQCLSGDRAERAARYLDQAARRGLSLVEPTLVARAMLSAGRPKEALAVANEHPSDPMMIVLRARALDVLGDRAAARAAIDRVATSTAALAPAALALAARWAFEAGQLDAGRDALDRLRPLSPQRLEVAILEVELAERERSAFPDQPEREAQRLRRVGRLRGRLESLDDAARAELVDRLPARTAAALAQASPNPADALHRELLEVAARAPNAPDELRLELAELQLRDRRTRWRGRALLRELATASEDRAVRASARRLLRR